MFFTLILNIRLELNYKARGRVRAFIVMLTLCSRDLIMRTLVLHVFIKNIGILALMIIDFNAH